ncbi:MAG: hypothetical protein D6710_01510 [Nitrospirae bacterium]|nr:MAG: hypothetical protein D6710_01510 [Nitrospirota bacterium]
MRFPCFKKVAILLVFVMAIFSIIPRVDASMVDSELLRSALFNRETDLSKIQHFLESKIVKKRLELLGYSPEEISKRLESLSSEELHQFASRIDSVRVGGDSGLGVVVTLLVIAILVVLLLQLTGHRVVVVED